MFKLLICSLLWDGPISEHQIPYLFDWTLPLNERCPRMNATPSRALREINTALKWTPRLIFEYITWETMMSLIKQPTALHIYLAHVNFVLAKLVLILLELCKGILVIFFVSPGSLLQFTNRDISSLLALLKAIMVYVCFCDTYILMIFTDTGICRTK